MRPGREYEIRIVAMLDSSTGRQEERGGSSLYFYITDFMAVLSETRNNLQFSRYTCGYVRDGENRKSNVYSDRTRKSVRFLKQEAGIVLKNRILVWRIFHV